MRVWNPRITALDAEASATSDSVTHDTETTVVDNRAANFLASGNRFANVPVRFHYFFARKVCFVKYSMGFVFMPGGFGTLDEMFEVLTLVQTQRITHFPLILFGRRYWSGLLRWMDTTLEDHQLISPGDLDLLRVTDDVDEAVQIIRDYRREVGSPQEVPSAFK